MSEGEFRLENNGRALVDHSQRKTIAFLEYHNGKPEDVERLVHAANQLSKAKKALQVYADELPSAIGEVARITLQELENKS